MRPLHAVCILAALIPEISADGDESQRLPEWIWAAAADTQREVTLSRSFSCEQSITEARLQVASEFAACSVTLNGRPVVTLDDYGPLLNLDVAQYLRLGNNTIQIRAKSIAGPAAIAVSLEIHAGASVSHIVSDTSWKAQRSFAVSSGQVDSKFWIDPRRDRINAFDNYEQWRLASSEDTADPPDIFTLPGFQVELLRKAQPGEGSWVSMAFDPQGRLTIAREDKGLLRMTFAADGKPASVETINNDLKECRGLLYAFGDLYANANNSKGLYRLRDSNGDQQFDDVQLLREFLGGVGHGRNDLALGPDGMIYSIHGDSVQLPQANIRDLTSPFRDGQLEQSQSQGHLVRTDRDGQNWDLVTTGLRNPFGIDFNHHGELFTYDADAEFDMGAPWYRPTRLNQLTSGADFGWRGLTKQWPPYELDHADNALPTATIGKGSPTAVKFGTGSKFPQPWRNALFLLDWTYGRIVACHLFPRGAGYVCRSETFVKGRPLNVTDLDFGPDGAMYIVTGGRKTESSLYRVRWVGTTPEDEPPTQHQISRRAYSTQQREVRGELEDLHVRVETDDIVDRIWPHLASPDPSVRAAACVAIEHQELQRWRERALQETNPQLASVALLSLARGTAHQDASAIVAALSRLRVQGFSAYVKLTALQAWSLCLASPTALDSEVLNNSHELLSGWLSKEANTALSVAPTGAGSVVGKLSRLVMTIDDSVANRELVQLMKSSTQQEDRMLFLFLLRHAKTGWESDDRETYFRIVNDLQTGVLGGDGMPGFLNSIREAAVASLSDTETDRLGSLVNFAAAATSQTATVVRPHVRDWAIDDIGELLKSREHEANPARGRELFAAALCSRCHRIGHHGGMIGPDLTSVGSRFNGRDLLVSILDPSAVVAEKYRNVQIVTTDGKSFVGQVLSSGDYRSTALKIAVDPLDVSRVVELSKSDVEVHQESKISPMPKGLLSTLDADEIADLLAYLVSGI